MLLCKVDGSQVARFLNQIPIFERYVVQRGSKGKHHEETCLKEIGLCFRIIIPTLRSIVKAIERTYVSR